MEKAAAQAFSLQLVCVGKTMQGLSLTSLNMSTEVTDLVENSMTAVQVLHFYFLLRNLIKINLGRFFYN